MPPTEQTLRDAAAPIGVIGDVHQDLHALRLTLDGPLREAATKITTGDFLDRGPAAPLDTIAHLRAANVQLVAGNHELAYLGGPAFEGMREHRDTDLRHLLRAMVIDGELVAARVAGPVLCVHAGVTRRFWDEQLRASCGADVDLIAATLNRWFLRAVLRGDFRHPVFAALDSGERGPFWADLDRDLLRPGAPPFAQAVGHTRVDAPGAWLPAGDGRVFPLDWRRTPGDPIGHLVVEDPPDAQ